MNATLSPRLMLTRTLALAFGLLGLLFMVSPGPVSSLFGIPADSDPARAYVRALGIRDVALCLYLLVLSRLSLQASVVVLGLSVVIPAGDLVLVLTASGLSALGPLALHALSGICLAALAVGLGRGARTEETESA